MDQKNVLCQGAFAIAKLNNHLNIAILIKQKSDNMSFFGKKKHSLDEFLNLQLLTMVRSKIIQQNHPHNIFLVFEKMTAIDMAKLLEWIREILLAHEWDKLCLEIEKKMAFKDLRYFNNVVKYTH